MCGVRSPEAEHGGKEVENRRDPRRCRNPQGGAADRGLAEPEPARGDAGGEPHPAGVPHGRGTAEGPLRADGDAAHQPDEGGGPGRGAAAGQDGNRPAAPPTPHRVRGEAPGGRHGRPHGPFRPDRGGVPVGARHEAGHPVRIALRAGPGVLPDARLRGRHAEVRRREGGGAARPGREHPRLDAHGAPVVEGAGPAPVRGGDPVDPCRQRDPPAQPPRPQARGGRADDLRDPHAGAAPRLPGKSRARLRVLPARGRPLPVQPVPPAQLDRLHRAARVGGRPVGGGARDPGFPARIRLEKPGVDPHNRPERPREVDHPCVARRLDQPGAAVQHHHDRGSRRSASTTRSAGSTSRSSSPRRSRR